MESIRILENVDGPSWSQSVGLTLTERSVILDYISWTGKEVGGLGYIS